MKTITNLFLVCSIFLGCTRNHDRDLTVKTDTLRAVPKVTYYGKADSVMVKKTKTTVNSVPKHTDEQICSLAINHPSALKPEEILHAATLTNDNKLKSKILEKATKVYPKNWKILNNAAVAQLNMGNHEKAGVLLKKADSINPNEITKTNLNINGAKMKLIKKVKTTKEEMVQSVKIPLAAETGYQKEVLITPPHDLTTIDSVYNDQYVKFQAGQLPGFVDYVFKRKMKVGVSEVVSIVISKNCPQKKIITEVQTLQNQGQVNRNVITISPRIIVKLQEAATGTFDIKPRFISPDQPVQFNDTSYTKFDWDVTPIIEGDHKLTFQVNLVTNTSPTPIYCTSCDGVIQVQSDKTAFGKFIFWIEQHWNIFAYIVSGIFAILAWLYKEKIITLFRKKSITD